MHFKTAIGYVTLKSDENMFRQQTYDMKRVHQTRHHSRHRDHSATFGGYNARSCISPGQSDTCCKLQAIKHSNIYNTFRSAFR